MSVTRLVLGGISALCLAMQAPADKPDLTASRGVQAAFERLVLADHWRDVNKARDELAEYGEQALTVVVTGT